MEDTYMEVYFDRYCATCRHEYLDESKSPCNECLGEYFNMNSHKPVKWSERKSKEKRKSFQYIKKEAIRTATELCYGDAVIQKLEHANTEYELDRILHDARNQKK